MLKALVEIGGVDAGVRRRPHDRLRRGRATRRSRPSWEALEAESGATRERHRAFARLLVERPNAVFVWSMGLTQHAHGVDTVRALVNVGLARGLPARPDRGLMPIRGHSGVQGGAEVGCVPARRCRATRARWASAVGLRAADAPG